MAMKLASCDASVGREKSKASHTLSDVGNGPVGSSLDHAECCGFSTARSAIKNPGNAHPGSGSFPLNLLYAGSQLGPILKIDGTSSSRMNAPHPFHADIEVLLRSASLNKSGPDFQGRLYLQLAAWMGPMYSMHGNNCGDLC